MDTHSGNNNEDSAQLQELKFEEVPGYRRAFVIAIAVMGIYLAILLIASPGSAKGHYGKKTKDAKQSQVESKPEKAHE